MDNRQYQQIHCISSHWLIEFLKSPSGCYQKYIADDREPQPSTDAMRFGSLVHCLALKPVWLEREFLIADYERRSKAGKQHHAELSATGLTVIRPKELERARHLVDILRADPDIRGLIHRGKKERMILKPRPGLLPLKARLDIHIQSKRQVVELKTIHSLKFIETAIRRFRYPLSAAFYADFVRANRFTFVFIETREPFRIKILPLSPEKLQEGREQYRNGLSRFDECWTFNRWGTMEPAPEPDPIGDDLLMMDFLPKSTTTPHRFDVPVGELEL